MSLRPYVARYIVEVPLACTDDQAARIQAELVHGALERGIRAVRVGSRVVVDAVRNERGDNVHERGAIGASARDGG